MDKERLLQVSKLLIKNLGDCDGVKCRECPCVYKIGAIDVCRGYGELDVCRGYDDDEVVRIATKFIKENE